MSSILSFRLNASQKKYIGLQVAAGLFTILLGKIVAVYFDPAEFGKYFIYTSAVSIYTMVIATPLIQAFRHFYFQDKDDLLHFFRSIFIWMAFLVLTILLILGVSGVLPFLFVFLIIGQILAQNNSALQIANINIHGNTTFQSVLQVLTPVFNLLLIFFIVFALHEQASVFLWASLIGTEMIILGLGFYLFRDNRSIKFFSVKRLIASPRFAALIRFIKPLMLLPVFMWIVNNLDRYLIDYFYSKEEVGIYSAAYSIGAKIFLLVAGGIIAYLNASVYKQVADPSQRHNVYKDTIRRLVTYILFGFGMVVVIWFSSDLIGRILLSSKYEASFALIPYLAMANLFLTSLFFIEQVIYALGDTKVVLYHYIVGAISNIGLNLFLIPNWGIYGAAWAMILSTFIQLSFLFWLFRIRLKPKTAIL